MHEQFSQNGKELALGFECLVVSLLSYMISLYLCALIEKEDNNGTHINGCF